MKKLYLVTIFSIIALMSAAQTKINVTIGGTTMTATLVDNSATCELVSMLSQTPVIIEMDDYGGFEKVGALPKSLPTSNSQITTEPGDIMLYQGRNMVIFYGSNSWSYTRLGKIDGATAETLRNFLGNGSVSVKLALDSSSGTEDVYADSRKFEKVYDLQGNTVNARPLFPGIYIIDGRKVLIK